MNVQLLVRFTYGLLRKLYCDQQAVRNAVREAIGYDVDVDVKSRDAVLITSNTGSCDIETMKDIVWERLLVYFDGHVKADSDIEVQIEYDPAWRTRQ
jgi:hypothetical protein